jgi:putative pyruvate formate lyase activating enzyme
MDSQGISPTDESRFVLEDFEPAYLETWRSGGLEKKLEAALAELAECRACPRNCRVNRLRNETRVCKTGRLAVVASCGPHLGEEECLRGWRGSGTIFFSLCNLRCVFCQNWDLSQRRAGKEWTAEEIATAMLQLEGAGCHNINFVTPEHVVPQVVEAIALAVPGGLRVPIVYNTSAYDALPSLKLMEGLVDIYMPDFKFWTKESARDLLKAKDYPERAREAILEMHRQVGPLKLGPDGVARRGVLIRHLVMPGQEDETAAIFEWLSSAVSPDTFVNIMGQYHPDHQVGSRARDGSSRYESINRRPGAREMETAYRAARKAGLWRFDQRRRWRMA